MAYFLFVVHILTVISMAATKPIFEEQWEAWKLAHEKSYANLEEELIRKEIWLENLKNIIFHNDRFDQGGTLYEMAMNQFGDLTTKEFANLYRGTIKPEKANRRDGVLLDFELEKLKETGVPQEVDWRHSNYVGKVRYQGGCQSCYAMVAVEALEGQLAKKTGQFVELSVQNIVDCSNEYKNYGCHGGLPYRVFEYIRDHGIETEEAYPYQGKENDKCLFDPSKSVTRIHGYKQLEDTSEEKLAAAVASVGPLSIEVHATTNAWRFYKSGILDDVNCNSSKIDHGLLLVGYVNKEPKGYWIAKNSWGESWGEGGYVRIVMGKNMCGITSCASYPII